MKEVAIYAWKKDGVFLYAGQTSNLKSRISLHRRKQPLFSGADCVVLRFATPDHASRIEGQVIAALRRKGQCVLNKNLPKNPIKRGELRKALKSVVRLVKMVRATPPRKINAGAFTRGGARKGSGRKPHSTPLVGFSCRMDYALLQRLTEVKGNDSWPVLMEKLMDVWDKK